MARTIGVAVLLWLLQILVLGALVSESWASGVLARERRLMTASLGAEASRRVTAEADGWYRALFVRTGTVEATYRFCLPTEAQARRSEPFRAAGLIVLPFVEERLTVLWMLVYQMLVRTASFALWLPVVSLLAVPAVIEGLMRRRIKQAGFDHASPVVHRYSLYAMLLLAYAVPVTLLWPFAVSPVVYPAVGAGIALALSLFVGNVQKRL